MNDFSEYMNPPESDYIKREDAQKITAKWLSGYITEQKEKLTADVVEVVRCKDCIHNEHNAEAPNAVCKLYYGMTDQYGFCSYGESADA